MTADYADETDEEMIHEELRERQIGMETRIAPAGTWRTRHA
jgi:hypothetical protein